MRTLLVFLLGLVLGALGYYLYQTQPQAAGAVGDSSQKLSANARAAAQTAADKTRAAAANLSDTLQEKIAAWHLTRDDIRADLAKTGEVIRDRTGDVGEKLSDARIVAMIKAKFVLDRELSANAIEVESHGGNVTLSGSVASEALIGQAVAHALDTDGVRHVAAKLTVQPRNR